MVPFGSQNTQLSVVRYLYDGYVAVICDIPQLVLIVRLDVFTDKAVLALAAILFSCALNGVALLSILLDLCIYHCCVRMSAINGETMKRLDEHRARKQLLKGKLKPKSQQ